METHYVDCACSDFGHVFRFILDETDGDIWLEVQLNHWRPWYKRAWLALRYLFLKEPAYAGHFDTTMLRLEDHAKIKELLDRSSDLQAKYVASRVTQEKPVLKG